MKIYADEAFYTGTYLSGREAVITTAFPYYAMQATAEIKRYINANLTDDEDIPESVKYCCCELAELLYKDAQAEQKIGGAVSESVQGWSKSYESADTRKNTLMQAKKACIYKWMADTGLMYRGM